MIKSITLSQQTLIAYALNMATIALTSTPVMLLQNIGMISGIAALVIAYNIEAKADKDSSEIGHAIYTIRTIWIWSLMLFVSLIGAEIVIVMDSDTKTLNDLALSMAEGNIPAYGDLQQTALLFFEANKSLILNTVMLWCAPAQLYALLRTVRGLERAIKGYRLKEPKTWL